MPNDGFISVQELFSVSGKTALITGGSRGIGLMIAQGFVRNGAKVYISSRQTDVCDSVARDLSKYGFCEAIPADLSTSEGREHLVNSLAKRVDSLDILINNAGATWGAEYNEFPEIGFDKILNINIKSLFFLTKELTNLLVNQSTTDNPSRVINIGSIEGIMVPGHGTFSYSASKAAVHHLTKTLARELGPRGITVNAIAPGLYQSKMTKVLLDNFQSHMEAACPLKRIGIPSDMAGIAIFLASRAASFINGAIIPVDGGLHLSSAF